MSRRVWIAVLMVVAGCQPPDSALVTKRRELTAYARLPGLRASHRPALRDELARLESERATPAMLQADPAGRAADREANPIVDLASTLSHAFPPAVTRNLNGRLGSLLAPERLPWTPADREAVRRLLEQFASRQRDFEEQITQPGATFLLRYDEGLAADLSFLQAFQAGHRMAVLDMLFRFETQLAVEDVAGKFEVLSRAIGLLAAQKNLPCRLLAAQQRQELLGLLPRCLRQLDPSSNEWLRIRQELGNQLANWPSDAEAWIGERAAGLHTYELVRDGKAYDVLKSIPAYAEVSQPDLAEFAEAVTQHVDDDEEYYLGSLRTIIHVCSRPYDERVRAMSRIEDELRTWRGAGPPPLLAQGLLRGHVVAAHRILVLDWFSVAAWYHVARVSE